MTRAEYQREWRKCNPEKCRGYGVRRWAEKKELVDNYLRGRCCMRCGELDLRVLEFHHRDRSEKKFCVRVFIGHSIASILDEMEKCDVLCANCHRLISYHGETY